MRAMLTAPALVILVSCAAPTPLPTPTGRADVSFEGVQRKEVINAIVSMSVARGYQVKKSDDLTIVMGKPEDSFLAGAMLGSQYDSTPERRVTFTILEGQGAIRVMANLVFVTNPGSGFERITAPNPGSKADHQIHEELLAIKARLEKR